MLRRNLHQLLQSTSSLNSCLPMASVITLIPDLGSLCQTLHTTSHPQHINDKHRNQFGGLWRHQSNLPAAQHMFRRGAASGADDLNLISLDSGLIRIEGYDETGFIVNDVQVDGPVLCYGDVFLMWNVESFEDITMDTLSLLDLIKPLPDLVVIGCGSSIKKVPESLLQELHRRRINVEALDTGNAVSTFNILNQESRKVLGALLPAGLD